METPTRDRQTRAALACVAAVLAILLLAAPRANAVPEGIHKIQHVVVIMQENRTFDSYFGTYPGANGIPTGVCLPDPLNGGCKRPYHNPGLVNSGGPHGSGSSVKDVDEGRMDGFVRTEEEALNCTSTNPACSPCKGATTVEQKAACIDVMGYHDAREIPNYWEYARHYVLQDAMFAPAASWSLTTHLFMVSGWSARCPHGDTNPLDCVGSLAPVVPALWWGGPIVTQKATYAWTDLTRLLARANVSWRYYVLEGQEPDCQLDEDLSCEKIVQTYTTPGIWNPLPSFTDVSEDHQLENVKPLPAFYRELQQGGSCTLAHVSWMTPNQKVGEHPPASIAKGQAYVTTLVNTIMRSPCWSSTAIFISWDEWGGFYDHVPPPVVDEMGYGIRVPGLVISPFAKRGYIDHQQLSHDAYLKFIEDDFLGGARLNPATDGRPDKRAVVRETAPGLGDLVNDFNFEAPPQPPLPLPAHPPPGPASQPPGGIPPPPLVATGAATAKTSHSATLNATVNPNEGLVSDCHFEYGATTAYGHSVPCVPPPGSGEQAVSVSAAAEGLAASTVYHFRVVATNKGGTSPGDDHSFTTRAPSTSALAAVASSTGALAAVAPSPGALAPLAPSPGALAPLAPSCATARPKRSNSACLTGALAPVAPSTGALAPVAPS